MKKQKKISKARVRYKYVLWFIGSYGEGWPTMNTENNEFTSKVKANVALKKHNRRWPEDKDQMSVKRFPV